MRLVWPARRVAPTPSRVTSVMPETRVSGDRQGGEPPSAIAMRWQPRGARFVRRHVSGDGSFAWSSDLRAFCRALAWPSGRYRTRQAIGCSCRRDRVKPVKPASGASGENAGGAASSKARRLHAGRISPLSKPQGRSALQREEGRGPRLVGIRELDRVTARKSCDCRNEQAASGLK